MTLQTMDIVSLAHGQPMDAARRIATNFFSQADCRLAQLCYADRRLLARETVDLLTPTNLPEARAKPLVLIRVCLVHERTANAQNYCSGIMADYHLTIDKVIQAKPVYYCREKKEHYKLGELGSRTPIGWTKFTLEQEGKLTELLWKLHAGKEPWDADGTLARTAPPGLPLKWDPLSQRRGA